jgi:hypothetical protein
MVRRISWRGSAQRIMLRNSIALKMQPENVKHPDYDRRPA